MFTYEQDPATGQWYEINLETGERRLLTEEELAAPAPTGDGGSDLSAEGVSAYPIPTDAYLPYPDPDPNSPWQYEANQYALNNVHSTGDTPRAHDAWGTEPSTTGATGGPPVDSSNSVNTGGSGSGGGSSYGGGGGNRSSGGGGSYGNDSFFDDAPPTRPTYADGSLHPAWGGDPRVPGGRFNDGSGGPATLPGGNRIEFRGANEAYTPDGSFGPGNQPWNKPKVVGNTGGGSGAGKDRYYQAKNALLGGIGGIAGSLLGNAPPTNPGGSGANRQPGGSRSGGTTPDPTERLRGWAGKQGFKGAALQSTIFSNPEFLLPHVFKGLNTNDTGFAMLENLPMADLAFLTKGADRGWQGEVGPYTNTLARMYRNIATKPRFFDYQQLSKNLFSAPKNSPLGMNRSADPNQQMYDIQRYYGAITNTTMAPEVASAYQARMGNIIDEWGAKNLKKNPKNQQSLYRYAGRRLR